MPEMKLDGKVAIVTGAGSRGEGIGNGRAAAILLANKIENMFGMLKDWRRIHTHYDRCAHTFMSAICIAATVIF